MSDLAEAYDSVPYENCVYDYTAPQYLNAVARLFGANPPDWRRARVLELGCASGGNLIPMAARWPKARFVGIDLSPVQIDRARDIAGRLGLDNIEFHAVSITDLTDELGQFDYIVAHGVLSWVPPEVQDATIATFARHLTPTGVGMLSYNTLPGWYAALPVRDMLMRHCARFATPTEKVAAAIGLLEFIIAAAPVENDPWRLNLARELHTLRTSPPAYLMHEYFESSNHQFYFHQVVDKLTAAGLQYLGDAHPKRMVAGNVPPKVAQTLAAIADPVEREQYVDFLVNQRFRATLICRPEVKLTRDPERARILDFCLASYLRPTDAAAIDLRQDQKVMFAGPGDTTVGMTRRAATALNVVLSERGGRPLPALKLITEAAARAGIRDKDEVKKALVDLGLMLVRAECYTVHAEESPEIATVSARPQAFAPARLLAAEQTFLPSARLGNELLGPETRQVLAACDGKHDHAALAALLGDAAPRLGAILAELASKGFLVG
ncbi:MAG: methyltransferase regulatory domain-containing protein [Bacteroidota bacterium]